MALIDKIKLHIYINLVDDPPNTSNVFFHHKCVYSITHNASEGAMKRTTKLQWFFVAFIFVSLFIMDKIDTTNNPSGKSIAHRKRGKGLLHKRESAEEFAVRTKIKYTSCMDPLLEGD